jgi:hypothetical protein
MKLPAWLTHPTLLRGSLLIGTLYAATEWVNAEGSRRSLLHFVSSLAFFTLVFTGSIKLYLRLRRVVRTVRDKNGNDNI